MSDLSASHTVRRMSRRPNVLLVLTDQLRYPPVYESEELARFRREHLAGQERLRQNGVSFTHHYPMAAACAPSRASLLTGQYPSLHGVTQTDGLAKTPDERGHVLARAGHRADARRLVPSRRLPDVLQGQVARLARPPRRPRRRRATCSRSTIDGKPIEENIDEYLKADLLDDYGFSEWVGPEPHGLGKHNTGTVKDPFTADETIELLERLDGDDSEKPVADGLLVPEPARRLVVRCGRAGTGAALPPSERAPRRAVADAPRGSVDQACAASRAWSTCGPGSARRSHGSRRI